MYNYKDKESNISKLNYYMLTRTLSMFHYNNLPDSIPCVEIEKLLQKNGFAFVTEVEGKLYAFNGSLGGESDVYGNPTKIIISNPYINFNNTLDIQKDGVLFLNDDLMIGLLPIYERYNTLLVENEITMYLNTYNTRIQTLISSGDDRTTESANKYIEKIIGGDLGIIGENRLFEGVKVQNAQTSNSSVTTQLIELNQYLKATLFNEVGLNANFNMKRERLNSSEVDMNTENLHPLIDNMMYNRFNSIQKLNEMYDLDVSVEFGSIWANRNETNDPINEEHDDPEEHNDPETLKDRKGNLITDDMILEEMVKHDV